MAHQNFNHLLDDSLQLKAAGLVGATANGSLVVDLGPGFHAFDVVVDWTACEVASTDELYTVVIQGATDSAMTTPYELVKQSFGDSSVSGDGVDTPPAGREVITSSNVQITSASDGNTVVPLRYIRIRTIVAGTVASGFNYAAWLTLRQK
jgi:hypothetical protein